MSLQTLFEIPTDTLGYMIESVDIVLGDGPYTLDHPVAYKGQPGVSVRIKGNGKTVINYVGEASTAFRFEGCYKSGIDNVEIRNKSATCREVVWFDAINADAPNTKNAGSHGCGLENVIIRNETMADTALIAVGHRHSVTSQVSELKFTNVLLQGKAGAAKGIGVDIRQGGNTKHFNFDSFGVTHIRIGINWPVASGVLIGRDMSFGACTECDIVQGGSGVLAIDGLNCEQSNQMLRQTGGKSFMTAVIKGFEWSGNAKLLKSKPDLWGLIPVQAHGAVTLSNGIFTCFRGVPILSMTYPTDIGYTTALKIDQCEFNAGSYTGLAVCRSSSVTFVDYTSWPVKCTQCSVAGVRI